MFRHLIILVDSSKLNSRVAFVKTSKSTVQYEEIKNIVDYVQNSYENEYVIHRFMTNSSKVESIAQVDPFFCDVQMYTEEDQFLSLLTENSDENYFMPTEVAKYVLSKKAMTHLRLQKVLYLIYAHCLSKGQKIFKKSPVAFDYGPVYTSVYHKYKNGKKQIINEEVTDDFYLKLLNNDKTSCLNEAIDFVLNMTKDSTDAKLVSATHVNDGPWAAVYRQGENAEITDSVILEKNQNVLNYF